MIPKAIYQMTTRNLKLNDLIFHNIDFLKSNNPEYSYKLFDDELQIQFLKSHYPSQILDIYKSFGLGYDAAKSDLFRYLLIYKVGGIYLDVKSTFLRPFDSFILESDKFLLSTWPENHPVYGGWGRHPEILNRSEFISSVIISEPENPYLLETINSVVANLLKYSPFKDGVGGRAVLNLTGPIAYTKAIESKSNTFGFREMNYFDFGFKFSVFENAGAHKEMAKRHYGTRLNPIISQGFIKNNFFILYFFYKNISQLCSLIITKIVRHVILKAKRIIFRNKTIRF